MYCIGLHSASLPSTHIIIMIFQIFSKLSTQCWSYRFSTQLFTKFPRLTPLGWKTVFIPCHMDHVHTLQRFWFVKCFTMKDRLDWQLIHNWVPITFHFKLTYHFAHKMLTIFMLHYYVECIMIDSIFIFIFEGSKPILSFDALYFGHIDMIWKSANSFLHFWCIITNSLIRLYDWKI